MTGAIIAVMTTLIDKEAFNFSSTCKNRTLLLLLMMMMMLCSLLPLTQWPQLAVTAQYADPARRTQERLEVQKLAKAARLAELNGAKEPPHAPPQD